MWYTAQALQFNCTNHPSMALDLKKAKRRKVNRLKVKHSMLIKRIMHLEFVPLLLLLLGKEVVAILRSHQIITAPLHKSMFQQLHILFKNLQGMILNTAMTTTDKNKSIYKKVNRSRNIYQNTHLMRIRCCKTKPSKGEVLLMSMTMVYPVKNTNLRFTE